LTIKNQFIYPDPEGNKLIFCVEGSHIFLVCFFAPYGAGVNEEANFPNGVAS
jgi:hypothetical protein